MEILTGRPPIDEQAEEYSDILSYMTENIFGELEEGEEEEYDQDEYESKIVDHLDKRAGDWHLKIAIQLFDLARQATNYHKVKRPTMVRVRELFEEIIKCAD